MPKVHDLPELLTRREAAEFLRVSLPAIDKYLRDRIDPVPCLKMGKRFLFTREDLVDWGRRQADSAGYNASGRRPPARRIRVKAAKKARPTRAK